MGPLSTAARRVGLLGTLAVSFSMLLASPAASHPELVSITPANGTQLKIPPIQLQMTFTASVNLIDDGIRLVDDDGATCPRLGPTATGTPSAGPCRRSAGWGLRGDMAGGVRRRTSGVSGASSFGVGAAAATVPDDASHRECSSTLNEDLPVS